MLERSFLLVTIMTAGLVCLDSPVKGQTTTADALTTAPGLMAEGETTATENVSGVPEETTGLTNEEETTTGPDALTESEPELAIMDTDSTGAMPISDELSGTTDTMVTTAAATLTADEESTAGVTGEIPPPASADPQTSVTLPDGVIYQVLQAGSGEAADSSGTLLIHYTLTRTDGTKLESSRDSVFPLPFEFTMGAGDAIRGMELGTAGMRIGEKRLIFVPSRLGYGATGQPPRIPPHTDLIFEVELVDIKENSS